MLSYRQHPGVLSRGFGAVLSPVTLSAHDTRPVSCYALFEGVAASEPTSWLSVQSYFLSHSARLWTLAGGPGCFLYDDGLISRRLDCRTLYRRYSEFG